MRHLVRGIFNIFFIVFLTPTVAWSETDLAPKLEIRDPVYNFGKVSHGTKVEHDFAFKNVGTAGLLIHRVTPTCGCTAAAATDGEIPPGGTGNIHVTFDTTGFSGEKVKTISVVTNDLNNQNLTLTLKGTVDVDVIVEPARISFGNIVKDRISSTPTERFGLKITENSDVSYLGITTSTKLIKAVEGGKDNNKRFFDISLSPELPVGEIRERLMIKLNRGGKEELVNVPVFGSIRGPLNWEPSSNISFGLIEGQEIVQKSVKLVNLGTELVNINSVTSNNPALIADLKTIEQGRTYVVNLRINPADIKDRLHSIVEVKTTSKEQATLSLNVYGVIPPKVPN